MDNFIDISLFSITNSIISKDNDVDSIVDELLQLILNRYNAEYCGIYFTFGPNQETIHRYINRNTQLSSNLKTEPIPDMIYACMKEQQIKEYDTGFLFPLNFAGINVGVLSLFFSNSYEKPQLNGQEKEFFISFLNHLASLILNLKNRDNIKNTDNAGSKNFIKGIGVSGRITMGKANLQKYVRKKVVIDTNSQNSIVPEDEITKAKKAINLTIEMLTQTEHIIRNRAGEDLANIFIFHRTILNDESFLNDIENNILNKNISAEIAIILKFNEIKTKFGDVNEHIKSDLNDLEQQILHFIVNGAEDVYMELPKEDYIYVCDLLLPSDIIKQNNKFLKGFIESKGGITGHAAILARSLNIPMITAVGNKIDKIAQGDELILDAQSGLILINPSEAIIDEYKRMQEEKSKTNEQLLSNLTLETYSKDSVRLRIGSNIGILSELNYITKYKSEFIGLYRTEFPFMIRHDFPTEEEQFTIYKKVVEESKIEVTFRALDIGGDKIPNYINNTPEDNPALGQRSLRMLLAMRDKFKIQIRAILRASMYGDIKLMFPMVSSIKETKEVFKIIEECKNELREKNIAFKENIPLGAMIEIPAAVMIIDKLLKYFDFVSIGTNDLVQYTLAVDRENPKVNNLFKPLHPAILRFIKIVIDETNRAGKEVTICGEMASEPINFLILAGLGLRNFSMNVHSIPLIKNIINKIDVNKATQIAEQALELETSKEIENILIKELKYII